MRLRAMVLVAVLLVPGAAEGAAPLGYGHEIVELYNAGRLAEARAALVAEMKRQAEGVRRCEVRQPVDLQSLLGIGVAVSLVGNCFDLEAEKAGGDKLSDELYEAAQIVLNAAEDALDAAQPFLVRREYERCNDNAALVLKQRAALLKKTCDALRRAGREKDAAWLEGFRRERLASVEYGTARIATYQKEAAASKDPEGVWIRAAADPGEAVKCEAARQLGDIGTERALTALRELAAGRPKVMDRCGPAYVYDMLARQSVNDIESRLLWAALEKDYPDARARIRRAAELLREHAGNPMFVTRAKRFLAGTGEPTARDVLLTLDIDRETARGLAANFRGDRRLIDALLQRVRLLDEPVPSTHEKCMERRELVCGALSFFRELADIRHVPELLRGFDVPEEIDVDFSLSCEARDAAIACGPAALPLMERFYGEAKTLRAREGAIIVIALIGGDEAVRFLEDALKKEQARPDGDRLDHSVAAHLERLRQAPQKTAP